MVFFVYLDPAVVRAAAAAGELGWSVLAAILQAAAQNCVVLDFDDYRWQAGIRAELDACDPFFERSLVKTYLATLATRNRVVPCFKDDYSGRREIEIVAAQAEDAELDCMVAATPVTLPKERCAESTTLASYLSSRFEQARSKVAAHGREYSGGELDSTEFLRVNFRKLLRHAARIEVCDAILGRRFSDNFEHGLKRFLNLVGEACHAPDGCRVVIHCEASNRAEYLHETVLRLQEKLLPRIQVEVRLYSSPDGQCLPHERYLWTDQFAIEIGRGMDFLDRCTGKNRDVSLSLKDVADVNEKVARFSRFRCP